MLNKKQYELKNKTIFIDNKNFSKIVSLAPEVL